MCELLGVSKQAYYKHTDIELQRIVQERFVVNFIQEKRGHDPGIGGNKLWMMYRNAFGDRNSVGNNRFYDIIDRYDLKVRKIKRRVQTTHSKHNYPLYPDLTRNLLPTQPGHLMVSDITYIPYYLDPDRGLTSFCHLSIITDYYSKEIVGYNVAPTLESKYTLQALDAALKHYARHNLTPQIHHSDRGMQYASYAYTSRLKSKDIAISMTERGNPKDNAVAERVNNTIKNELLKGMTFVSLDEVRQAVDKAILFYNEERPHLSLDGMTPKEAARCRGEIKKRWVSYREKAIKAFSQ